MSRARKMIIINECYKCGSGIELSQVAIRQLEDDELVRDKNLIAIDALCRKCIEKLKKRYKE